MVDDDAAIRKIGQLSLSKVGKWQVIMAESGAQGLELAIAENPDVILLDVMMHGMDGPTTFQRMKDCRELASKLVIFMTAKVQSHEVENYIRLGALGVIKKPFDPMTLPREIEGILQNHPDSTVSMHAQPGTNPSIYER